MWGAKPNVLFVLIVVLKCSVLFIAQKLNVRNKTLGNEIVAARPLMSV